MIREKLPELEDLINDFLDEAKEKGPSENLAQMTLKGKTKKEGLLLLWQARTFQKRI